MIVFNIALKNTKHLNENKLSNKQYISDIDDETSVIYDICNIFDEAGIKFIVSGFGENNWPVDCVFDLPEIIQDLPRILIKINQGNYNFKLNFDEQGIERKIIFEENENRLVLKCISRTNWQPNPSTIELNKEYINTLFYNLYKDFIYYSNILCCDLINDTLLSDWLNLLK